MIGPTNTSPIADLIASERRIDADDGRLQRANAEFEAVLLRQLVSAMRKTIPKGPNGKSNALVDHFVEDTLSRHLAEAGGIGLADLMSLKTQGNGAESQKK